MFGCFVVSTFTRPFLAAFYRIRAGLRAGVAGRRRSSFYRDFSPCGGSSSNSNSGGGGGGGVVAECYLKLMVMLMTSGEWREDGVFRVEMKQKSLWGGVVLVLVGETASF